ncbi:hypothetical protein Lal_00039967 [Lupinus albus]|nr:hypothetical protein Lal_00039967 [Lupinus albus]
MVGTTNIHLVRSLDTMTNSKKLSGIEDKEIVGVTLSYLVPTYLMLRINILQEGWLDISCKNTSPAQLIKRILQSFLILCNFFIIIHIKGEPYEMKILRMVLERRFFELNDDRNGCRINR